MSNVDFAVEPSVQMSPTRMQDWPGQNDALSDDQLIQRCRKGDQKAFDTLYRRYERQVYNLAYRLARNHDDAHEVVSEAFLKIYCGLSTIQQAVSLKAWINRIVVNVFINMQRHRRRRPAASLEELQEKIGDVVFRSVDQSAVSPHLHAEASERTALLDSAIEMLPASQRPLVTLFHRDGRSYEEIAAALKIPTGTVKSRLNRARMALRETLTPHASALVS